MREGTLLQQVDVPLGQISHVDEHRGVPGVTGSKNLTAAIDAGWPVGESVGGVARSHYETGPYDQGPAGQRVVRLHLTQHLGGPVGNAFIAVDLGSVHLM